MRMEEKKNGARALTCEMISDHLNEEERAADDGGAVAVGLAQELLVARERRAEHVAEVGEGDVGVRLDEHHAVAGAIHHQLPRRRLHLADPSGDGVVVHERVGEPSPDHRGGVGAAAAATASPEEVEARPVEPEAVLVVDVGQRPELPRRRPRRRDELRRRPRHGEGEGGGHAYVCTCDERQNVRVLR